MALPHTIIGTVQSFEEDNATIVLDNNDAFRVPKSLVPESANVGTSVQIAIFSDADVAPEQERLAKAVLKELLRSS